jgi:hypothetical protein
MAVFFKHSSSNATITFTSNTLAVRLMDIMRNIRMSMKDIERKRAYGQFTLPFI